uniref:Protein krueppel n=2 Tax=Photinus pyralis TaxID=7054 RepID=A0A1Y1L696_PHOPY
MINKETQLIMQKICRSCMCEGTDMKSVFEAKAAEEGQILLADMLMACTSIQITTDDGLPVQLCVSCETKLDCAFEFKQQCQKTDVKLRGLTNQGSPNRCVKEESLDIVVQPDLGDSFIDRSVDSDCSEAPNPKLHPMHDLFTCSYCQKVLRTKKGLKIHQRRHTGEKMRSCHLCQAKFTRTNHLRRHLETHNKSNKSSSHVCVECGAAFSKAIQLSKHKKEHQVNSNDNEKEECESPNADDAEDANWTGWQTTEDNTETERSKHSEKLMEKKVMECEFCDRKFKYKKSFIHHLQMEHGMTDANDVSNSLSNATESKLDSETREFEVSDPTELKDITNPEVSDDGITDTEFLKPKENRKLHTCHVCEAKFSRTNHLTRHMTLHRAVLTEQCNRCEKAFATSEHLAKHLQENHIDKPYICTVCNKQFSRGEHLIRHLKIHDPTDGSEANHTCSICNKSFSRSDLLARHTKVHLKQDKRHICGECGKAFNRLDNLKTHQRIHTGIKDSKLHLCIYCGKEFNNSSNMIVHMRRHTGERPYKCTICSKGFPRSHDLKCHERTHSGEKPYLCTLCGKSFNKSNKLLRHTRVHTGERPYVCNLCGRAFTQSNDLALHMRRHTGSRPYACGVCPSRFIQSGQLKAHRRSTGHWMETQPDLKGGHRVEPVTPITNPAPIKFKTHGIYFPKEGEEAKLKEPKILNHTVGIMGNINIQNNVQIHSQPIILDSAKLIQQCSNGTFVGFTSVINASPQVVTESGEEKFKTESAEFTITGIECEENLSTDQKMETVDENGITYTAIAASASTFTNGEHYTYQSY